jgi:hypothetical protein
MKMKILRLPKSKKWIGRSHCTIYQKCLRIMFVGLYLDIPLKTYASEI